MGNAAGEPVLGAPPDCITIADLADVLRQACVSTGFATTPHPDSPGGAGWWILPPSAIGILSGFVIMITP